MARSKQKVMPAAWSAREGHDCWLNSAKRACTPSAMFRSHDEQKQRIGSRVSAGYTSGSPRPVYRLWIDIAPVASAAPLPILPPKPCDSPTGVQSGITP